MPVTHFYLERHRPPFDPRRSNYDSCQRILLVTEPEPECWLIFSLHIQTFDANEAIRVFNNF